MSSNLQNFIKGEIKKNIFADKLEINNFPRDFSQEVVNSIKNIFASYFFIKIEG